MSLEAEAPPLFLAVVSLVLAAWLPTGLCLLRGHGKGARSAFICQWASMLLAFFVFFTGMFGWFWPEYALDDTSGCVGIAILLWAVSVYCSVALIRELLRGKDGKKRDKETECRD